MEPAYKLCPRCGTEFQDWVTHCSDCGAELDWAPQHPPEPSGPLPPARELLCIHVADPWVAREVAEALQSAGVPCRIDSHPPDSAIDADPHASRGSRAPKVGVYVRDEDMALAAEIETELLARRSPELAERGETREPDANACPACGAVLDPSAQSCASCGLSFPDE